MPTAHFKFVFRIMFEKRIEVHPFHRPKRQEAPVENETGANC